MQRSCPMNPNEDCGWDDFHTGLPNPHTLFGALVGGPGSDDGYFDARSNYINNEVTCDYNAGFQGVIACML